MAIIGTFTKNGTGFTGTIRTLGLAASVSIEPVSERRGDKSPDFRVQLTSKDASDIGAAWNRTKDGATYLSVRIDDPAFPAPVDCRLIKTGIEHSYSLVWERKR